LPDPAWKAGFVSKSDSYKARIDSEEAKQTKRDLSGGLLFAGKIKLSQNQPSGAEFSLFQSWKRERETFP